MLRVLNILIVYHSLFLLSFTQHINHHISDVTIYNFLDELASEKIIHIYSVTKPYSRLFIYTKLKEAEQCLELDNRQKEELNRYLDYYGFGSKPNYLPSYDNLNLFNKNNKVSTSINHVGIFYSDSLLNFSLRPVYGIQYYSNSSGAYTYFYGGAEAFATIGKHISLYTSLRDNTFETPFNDKNHFTEEPGGAFKWNVQGNLGVDYSEARGGISIGGKIGSIALVKDHVQWGDGYKGPIILSGRSPSFPMLKLHLNPAKWIDFNYFHGWLISEVIDSTRSYTTPGGNNREVLHNKYMAANMFTISPISGLNISFGNSIIYSDINVNPAFFIPFLFYKSVDHTITNGNSVDNQNSQMFFNLSSRLIKHTHFYASLFVDEFSITRVNDPNEYNFHSYKIGSRIFNWPIPNIHYTIEFTKSLPATYKHYVETITFESNEYNLGYYLRDNSKEIYFDIGFRPIKYLKLFYSFSNAKHGGEYPYSDGKIATRYNVLDPISWSNTTHLTSLSYQVFTNVLLGISYINSNIQGYNTQEEIYDNLVFPEQPAQYYLDMFTPPFFQGSKNTLILKLNIGF